MKLSALWTNPKVRWRLIAVIVVIGASLAYLGDYFHGNGEWTVFSPQEIVLRGVDGDVITVRGQFAMSENNLASLRNWLVGNGFAPEEEDGTEGLRYSRKSGLLFHTTVTIPFSGDDATPTIGIRYSGQGFRRFLLQHEKEAMAFSNELAKRCAGEALR